jgi:hypothetical protein
LIECDSSEGSVTGDAFLRSGRRIQFAAEPTATEGVAGSRLAQQSK